MDEFKTDSSWNRTKGLYSVIVLASFAVAHAGDLKRIDLDGNEMAVPPAVERRADGSMRIHKVDPPQLVLFPASTKPSRGTVLVFPGGGYVYLSIEDDGRDVGALVNGAGYDAAVLLYRVGEDEQVREWALGDARRALALVRRRGTELGLATNRIGLMGFSAGGHLAARVAHETVATAPPDFIALIYPAYLDKRGRLRWNVTPGRVASFVYVAADDAFVVGARAYADYCESSGVRCDYHEASSGGHGFQIRDPLPEGVKDWTDKLRAFLQEF